MPPYSSSRQREYRFRQPTSPDPDFDQFSAAADAYLGGRTARSSYHEVTPGALGAIMGVEPQIAGSRAPGLNQAMQAYHIDSQPGQAMLLSQIGPESGGMTAMSENLNYKTEARLRQVFGKRLAGQDLSQFLQDPVRLGNTVYANRLGNAGPESGDGYRYRGRGLIQLTGKDNYAAASRALGIDLVANPDQVASDPDIAARTAAWFYATRPGVDAAAKAGNVDAVTRMVNGPGMQQKQARAQTYQRAIRTFSEEGGR